MSQNTNYTCPFQVGSTEDVLEWLREAKIAALPHVDSKSLCRPAPIYLEVAKEITRIDERALAKPQEGVAYAMDTDLPNQTDLYSVYVQLCNTAAVLGRIFDAALCPGFSVTDLTKTFSEKQNGRVRRFLSAQLNLLSFFRMRLYAEICKVKEEKEVKSTQDSMLRSQIVATRRELASWQAELGQLQQAVKQHEALRDNVTKREAECDREIESLTERFAKVQSAIEAEKRRRDELLTQRASLKRTIESYENMIVRSPERVRKEIDSLRESIKTQLSLKKDAVRHCSDRSQERDALADFAKRYEEAIGKVNRLRELISRYTVAQHESEACAETVRERQNDKQTLLNRLRSGMATLQTRTDLQQRMDASEQAECEEFDTRRAELESTMRTLRAAINEVENSFADWKTELESFVSRQSEADRRDTDYMRQLTSDLEARVAADLAIVVAFLRKLDDNSNL